MINVDEKDILGYLSYRRTLVGKTMRILGIGMGTISLLTGAHTIYSFYQNKKLESNARRVLQEHESLIVDMRNGQSNDSMYALKLENARLKDSLDRVLAFAPTDEAPSVRIHMRPQPAQPCGVDAIVEREGYRSTQNKCTLTVEIPRGGSISGASLAYFGDMHRWKQDSDFGQNADIGEPDTIEPGTNYTFRLP